MQIFSTYARANRSFAAELSAFLRENGHVVWWDHQLRGGERFHEAIREQIHKAQFVLVLWSVESVQSDFVLDEADLGKQQGKLVPARLDDVQIPLGFGTIHTIDLTSWPHNIEEVLGAVGGVGALPRSGTLGSASDDSAKPNRKRLTKVERLLLINQYRILEQLFPKERDDCRLMIRKLESGYMHRLSILDDYLADDLSDEVHNLVFDVLEMYRSLTFSFMQLTDKTGIDEGQLVFHGFDGNYESEYLAYARYLLDGEQLYAELSSKKGYNSHTPMLERYRLMTEKWKNSANRRSLSRDDILALVAGRDLAA